MNPILHNIIKYSNPVQAGIDALIERDIRRTTPGATPAGAAIEQLAEAFDKRVDKIAPGKSPVPLGLKQNLPAPDVTNVNLAGNNRRSDGGHDIFINPNTDRSWLAHELGHSASDQTKIGNAIRTARDTLTNNPKLASALLGAGLLGSGANAVLNPGDDDLATSIILATAASTPKLLDEMLATKNGLAIMDTAGMRANLGQRGRLAGGLLQYAATPLTIGLASNIVGNQFDEDVTLGM